MVCDRRKVKNIIFIEAAFNIFKTYLTVNVAL